MKLLISFFVDRPLIVNLLMLLVAFMAIDALQKAPLQSDAVVDFGLFTVVTHRAGASAEKMELSITVPLEEELLDIDNIKQITSRSIEGLSLIQLNADPSASDEELAVIEKDIQRAIENAKARLPKDLLEQPLLSKSEAKDRPTVKLMVTGTASEELLRRVTQNLQSELRSKRTISSVSRSGYRDRQLRIMLDPAKLAQFKLSFDEIEQAIQGRNVSETGGSLESFVSEQDVVLLGEFEHPTEVGSVILRASEHGDYLRLSDVADVVMDYDDWRVRYFYQGQAGIALDVTRAAWTNEIAVVDDIKAFLTGFQKTLPDNVKVIMVEDGAMFTRSLVSALLSNALMGMLLITITLLLFFPWRAMVWVVVGLPVAILLGLLILLTMDVAVVGTVFVAVILMMGLLVDDAIVVSESIYSFFERGESPRAAAVDGLMSVFKPVCTGAATTVLAMMPMLLIGGADAKWLWVVPATVICLVTASLLETMFFLPSHLAGSLASHGHPSARGRWFIWIEDRYRGLLAFYLKRPLQSVLALAAFAVVSVAYISSSINFKAYPAVESDEVMVLAEMPVGASLDATTQALRKLEEQIHNSPVNDKIAYTYLAVGHHQSSATENLIEGEQKNWGKIYVRLFSHNDRSESAKQIAGEIQIMADQAKEFDFVSAEAAYPKPPVGRALELSVTAAEDDRFEISRELLAFLDGIEGVARAWTDYTPGVNSIELELDHKKMADYGLKASQLSKAIKVAFDGMIVEELQTPQELIRFRLQLQDEYRNRIEALPSLPIITSNGETVPLRNVATFVSGQSESAILHTGGKRTETVFAVVDIEKISTVDLNNRVKKYIQDSNLYQRFPGVSFNYSGEVVSQAESANSLFSGVVMILLSIFILMALLFNSLMLPLITLMVIPISFIGVLLVFTLQGITISLVAVVGFMGLTGVLVNGSLVMIDKIQSLHGERGQNTSFLDEDDITEGAVNRLRPLMITGITGFVGLGPAAYGLAGTDPTTQDMLLVMFWGIAVGSIATLFALPIYLVLHSRFQRWLEHRQSASV